MLNETFGDESATFIMWFFFFFFLTGKRCYVNKYNIKEYKVHWFLPVFLNCFWVNVITIYLLFTKLFFSSVPVFLIKLATLAYTDWNCSQAFSHILISLWKCFLIDINYLFNLLKPDIQISWFSLVASCIGSSRHLKPTKLMIRQKFLIAIKHPEAVVPRCPVKMLFLKVLQNS